MIVRVRMHIAFCPTSVEFLKLSLYGCLDFFGGRGQGICELLGCQSWRYQAIPGTEEHVKDIEN